MTTAISQQMHLNVDIGGPSNKSPVSKLAMPTVHRIEPDDEVAVHIISKLRVHKSRAGSTITKTQTEHSSSEKNHRFLHKRLNRGPKSKSTSHHPFNHFPLPPPPMLPTLRAGETVTLKK
jgi:hypothetical protein